MSPKTINTSGFLQHRFILRVFWLFLCFGISTHISEIALAEVAIPTLSSPVIDGAGFFSRAEKERIEVNIHDLFAAQGPQLQIWTLSSLEGEPIESLSIRAVDAWQLGRAGKDDGLLLTIARAERRYRLEVGRGLEGEIPDIVAKRMLRHFLVPALRRSKADFGVARLIDEIARLTLPNGGANFSSRAKKQSPVHAISSGESAGNFDVLIILWCIFSFLLILIVVIVANRRKPRPARGFFDLTGLVIPRTQDDERRRKWSGDCGRWSGDNGRWSGGGGRWSGGGSSGGW